MAYVSDSNLTQFWGLAKDYINAEDGRFANWQKTEKAGAVSCYSVGETPLLPTVDFMFTETGPDSGDKGPDNPSTITGVTQAKVTRCGKNLIKFPYSESPGEKNGVTFTIDADGSVTLNGTANTDEYFYIALTADSPYLFASTRYTLSGCPTGGSINTYYMRHSGYAEDVGNGSTFTASTTGKTGNICIVIKSGTTVSNLVFKPQLELGSTATAFEPYSGADYTINLGSTYYGGSIDLATGLMTVTWVGESVDVFYNTSLVGTNTVAFRFDCSYAHGATSATTDELVCNKFVSEVGDGDNEHCRFVGGAGSDNMFIRFFISKSRLDVSSAINPASPTDAEWKVAANAWLSSNPVFISYKINNPFAVQLTPIQILSLAQPDKYTPRLNTVYTDASSVQVGYAKSPIRSEYELTQAIIATEGGE